jgi:hypothetical protein
MTQRQVGGAAMLDFLDRHPLPAILDKMAASSTHRLGRGNPTLKCRSGNDLNLGAAVLCCRRRACSHALGSGKLLAGGRWPMVAHGCRTTAGGVRC